MNDDKLIISRLESIADALETGEWSREYAVEELRFIASELKVADEIRCKSIEEIKKHLK